MPRDAWKPSRSRSEDQRRLDAQMRTTESLSQRLNTHFTAEECAVSTALQRLADLKPVSREGEYVSRPILARNAARYSAELRDAGLDVNGTVPDGRYVRLKLEKQQAAELYRQAPPLVAKAQAFINSCTGDEKHMADQWCTHEDTVLGVSRVAWVLRTLHTEAHAAAAAPPRP